MSDIAARTVELVVQLTPEATPGSPPHAEVLERAAELEISFAPVDLSTPDSELGTYQVALVTPEVAERAIEALRHCRGVEAAFAKPRGEAPNGGNDHA